MIVDIPPEYKDSILLQLENNIDFFLKLIEIKKISTQHI
jgi:hypothetical protein